MIASRVIPMPCKALLVALFVMLLLLPSTASAAGEGQAEASGAGVAGDAAGASVSGVGQPALQAAKASVTSKESASKLQAGSAKGKGSSKKSNAAKAKGAKRQKYSEASARRLAAKKGVSKVHRLYNLWTGSYLFTASMEERRALVRAGWLYEGVGWLAPKRSKTPVYRLLNKRSGDHMYTASARKKREMHKKGWRYEGIGWYAVDGQKASSAGSRSSRAASPGVVVSGFNNGKLGMERRHAYFAFSREKIHAENAGWKSGGKGWRALSKGWIVERVYRHDHLEYLLGLASTAGEVTAFNGSLDPAAKQNLESKLDRGAYVDFIGINTRTGKVVSRNADTWHYGASTVKAPYLASLCMYDAPGIGARASEMYSIVTYSSNDLYMRVASAYGHSWFDRMAEASGTEIAYTSGGPYAEFTPRRLTHLWVTMADYLKRGGPNSDLFAGLFGNGGYFKEGWMYAGMYGGQLYHMAGTEGDCVYAIMTGYVYRNSAVSEVKDALIAALS